MSSDSKDRAITPARTASHDRPAKRACDRSPPSRSPPRRHGDDEERYRRQRAPRGSRSRSRSAECGDRRWWQRMHAEDYDDEGPAEDEFTVRIDGHDDLFNCDICDGLLSSPVYECGAGHLACQRCYDEGNYEECRECGSTEYSRSVAVANLLRSIRFPCGNREYGCRVFLPRHDMAVHERSCEHAPCFCPARGCGFHCPASSELESHLVRRHGWRRHLIRYGEAFPVPVHEPSVLRAVEDGRLFHLSRTQERTGTALSLICIRPDNAAEGQFTYEVKSPATADGSRPTRLRMESTVWCTSLRHGMDDGNRVSIMVPDDMLHTVEVCVRKVPVQSGISNSRSSDAIL